MSDQTVMIQPRTKRQKYTHNACNECKRRKAKCNGDPTCERCASFNIQCVYPPTNEGNATRGSEEIRRLHDKIDLLQRQVSTLVAHVQTLPAPSTALSSPLSHPQNRDAAAGAGTSPSLQAADQHPTPAYLGPTSFTFGLDVAQAELERTHAYKSVDSEEEEVERPPASRQMSTEKPRQILADNETRFNNRKPEVLHLIGLYEETTGQEYPCVDIGGVKALAEKIFNDRNDPAWISRTIYGRLDESAPFDRDLEILRIILAIGYVIDGNGQSDIGARLMDRTEDTMAMRFKVFEVDTKELLLFFLMSFYYFYCGNEILAYRSTGLAARGALEMGLHRRSTWARTSGIFPGELQRSWAIKLFWCIYVLDRRWSLGTGLPFALQDADMDTELPELDETTPYLRTMVSYGRLASKVWQAVAGCENGTRRAEADTTSYLDFLVQQWSSSIPPDLQTPSTFKSPSTASERTQRMLQTLLHLKANQMRIILHKPDLLSKESIMKNMAAAHLVVNVARDTIQTIDSLNRTTEIYQRQNTAFDYFLVSAVAVVFLTVCYTPDIFFQEVQEDIHVALNLVKGFLATSWSARRLWKTIRHLRHLGPGLDSVSKGADDGNHTMPAHSDNFRSSRNDGAYQSNVNPWTVGNAAPNETSTPFSLDLWPEDGLQVSRELDSMFEAFGRPYVGPVTANGLITEWSGLEQGGPNNNATRLEGFEDDTEFSRLIMELF